MAATTSAPTMRNQTTQTAIWPMRYLFTDCQPSHSVVAAPDRGNGKRPMCTGLDQLSEALTAVLRLSWQSLVGGTSNEELRRRFRVTAPNCGLGSCSRNPMYEDRRTTYEELEDALESKVIAYVTGDRRQLETKIASEVLDFFVHHLDVIGVVPKLTLILHTRGGDTLAAWSLANLLRSFADQLEVVVPAKAHSAGTLISLGADSIMMTKQATLGPIDPSVSGPLNPEMPGGQPGNRVPVSVEDINGYLDFAKSALSGEPTDLTTAFQFLASEVNPLVLGNAFRARSQIRMLGQRLLENHMTDAGDIGTILDFLCSESGSHDYTINRREAADDLALPVAKPSQELYEVIKRWHDNMSDELELNVAYDPNLLLGASQQTTYRLPRALIESRDGGSDVFLSEGSLTRQQVQIQPGVIGDAVHDQRTFEGWRHHDPS